MRYFLLLIFAAACTYAPENSAPLVSIQIQDRNGLTETISQPDRLEVFENVDFLASQPYKKVLRIFRQEGRSLGKITTYHPNGLIRQYLEAQDMRAFGSYKEWHPNGKLKIEATVIGGTADVVLGAQKDWLFDGPALLWDEQGRMLANIHYQKGALEGKSTYYYPNGQIQKELNYVQNELEGECVEFLQTGQMQTKATYIRGLKNGEGFSFWTSEQISSKELYQDGLLLEGAYFAKDGSLLSEVKDGSGFQVQSDRRVEYRKGKPEGVVKIFSSNGELKSTHHIKNGQKQGEEIEYFDDSLPKISIPWEKDVISGIVKTWYPNGKIQSQREISRNKKSGPSLAWYTDGSLMFMEEYEEDRLTQGQYYKKNARDPISTVASGNGIATLYDEQGIFLRKVQYVKGKPIDPEN